MRSNLFDYPNDAQIADSKGIITVPWGQWFSLVQTTISAARQSGTTANRPTSVLWVGRQYYDTTLGKPVFVDSVNPTVWHDASGAIV